MCGIVFDTLKDDNLCIYFNEPTPVRVRLIEMLRLINPDFTFNSAHITIAELKDDIIKELGDKIFIIIFNNFEKLSKRSVAPYEFLIRKHNIQFICSFNTRINRNVYQFRKNFKILNEEEYTESIKKSEINVTYSLYILISIICFFVYIKSANSIFMASILLGGAWFALIIFRTMMYAGGRV